MLWIYILLFIILALMCLLILLLFIPINLIIKHDKDLDVKLKILFFKFNLYDSDSTKTKKSHINKSVSSSQNISFRKSINKIKKIGIINFLNLIVEAIKTFGKIISGILQKIDFNDIVFNLEIGSTDACSTAISYGQASAAITLIYNHLISLEVLKSYQISVNPNFLSEKISCKLKLDVSFRIFNIILVLIRNRKEISNLLNFKYVGEADGK